MGSAPSPALLPRAIRWPELCSGWGAPWRKRAKYMEAPCGLRPRKVEVGPPKRSMGPLVGYLTTEVNQRSPAPRIMSIEAGAVGCPAMTP